MSSQPTGRSGRRLDLRDNVHLREVRRTRPDTAEDAGLARQTDGSYFARTAYLAPGVDTLLLSGCRSLRSLPERLWLLRLSLNGCIALERLPEHLTCYELEARSTHLRSLPSTLKVEYRLDLEGCTELEDLPEGLQVGTLVLRGCTSLRRLPEGLSVAFLDLSSCVSLRGWPERGELRSGRLRATNCTGLRTLPPWLTELSQLDLCGCSAISELPEGLRISSWIDVAGTGLRALPASLDGVEIRWRGVPVDARIAFHPETITTSEVLGEPNVERRRVVLERLGYERFLREAGAVIQDHDRDPGGERRLLRIRIPDDEDLVCVSVICPSTGRQYLIRVPPTMRTCRQAVAWTAGFDNPNDYRPLVET